MIQQNNNPPVSPGLPGFALVVTLVLMVLLAILGLGLLSLSSVALRSASASAPAEEARQNARLSVMLALAQLQKLAGQDTRVTVGSSLVSESNVKATGVWRSWEGSDRDSSGKPVPPDYAGKTRAGKPDDLVGGASDGRFLGWLASPLANASPDTASLAGLSLTAKPGNVPLVSSGSVSKPADEVHVDTTMVNKGGSKGAFAWWVSGENSKAMLNVDRVGKPTSTVGWHTRMKSNGRADAESFGLEEVNDLPVASSIPSTKSLERVDPSADLRKLHEITAFSNGLLTNTATGGWRKDLSLLSENFAGMPGTELPSLTVKPGQVRTFSKAQPSQHPPNALLYPWANYRADAGAQGWMQVPPICSWTALMDYMVQYRNLTTSSSANTAMPFVLGSLLGSGNRFQFQEQVRRIPQVARLQWIFSLSSRKKTDPGDPAKTYQPALMVTPVLTLWNPYNVELTVPNFQIRMKEIAPISFSFKVGTQEYEDTTLTQIFKSGEFSFDLKINSQIRLPPGGTRIFGLNNNVPQENTSSTNVVLQPGYQPNGGFLFYGLNKGNDVYALPTDTFAVGKFAYNGTSSDDGIVGLGMFMDIFVNGTQISHRMMYRKDILGGPSVVDALYPPVTNAISAKVSEVEGLQNKPFAGAVFGFRPATPRPREARFNNLATKGMLNANPLNGYSEVGGGDEAEGHITMAGTGVYHPMNAPYDFSFQDVNGWNDTRNIPQFEPGSNSSYIVSGLTAGDGLTRCVIAELPTRPLQGIAELQHFDARNNNPITPFVFNLIGNGSAHPVFAPDQVSVTATGKNRHMSNDDSYILNNMLFDDWFVSSIAPDLNDFSSTVDRQITKVYKDHLDFKEPLPNRFYVPAPGADATFNVSATAKDAKTGMYGYETVASQLVVEGMININSVSLEAWKSWLRQGRKARVPFLAAGGATTLDSEKSFAFPRTSIAGDKATGSGSGASNPLFPDAAEYTGYTTLTEIQIDALAEEIVKEIRKRGPFLSLSEFVNRRLTTNRSLAAAGTIQQALDTLSKSPSPSRNPFARLQANAVEITAQPPGVTDYKFPEAALGSSAFGMPGWIRQADILKLLGPMISARDDTFTIRGYGDSRDKTNSSRILARAWCEVVVRRSAAYVDPADLPQVNPLSPAMTSETNRRYGRRFEIVSFRWLNADEV